MIQAKDVKPYITGPAEYCINEALAWLNISVVGNTLLRMRHHKITKSGFSLDWNCDHDVNRTHTVVYVECNTS